MTDDLNVDDQINPAHYKTAHGFEAMDVIEMYGLPTHLAVAFQHLIIAQRGAANRNLNIEQACWYLHRWNNDPNDNAAACSPSPDALEWADPVKIVAAFGLKDDIAVAVTYILNLAAFGGNEEIEIEKALLQLEKQMAAA